MALYQQTKLLCWVISKNTEHGTQCTFVSVHHPNSGMAAPKVTGPLILTKQTYSLRCTVVLQILIMSQLVNKFSLFVEPGSSFLCAQKPATDIILSQLNPVHIFTPFFSKSHFNITYNKTLVSHWETEILAVTMLFSLASKLLCVNLTCNLFPQKTRYTLSSVCG